jgi:hypothetical protein
VVTKTPDRVLVPPIQAISVLRGNANSPTTAPLLHPRCLSVHHVPYTALPLQQSVIAFVAFSAIQDTRLTYSSATSAAFRYFGSGGGSREVRFTLSPYFGAAGDRNGSSLTSFRHPRKPTHVHARLATIADRTRLINQSLANEASRFARQGTNMEVMSSGHATGAGSRFGVVTQTPGRVLVLCSWRTPIRSMNPLALDARDLEYRGQTGTIHFTACRKARVGRRLRKRQLKW